MSPEMNFAMHRDYDWTIELRTGNYMDELSRRFGSRDISLNCSDDPETGHVSWALSYHLNGLMELREVIARAFSLQVFLNGSLRVAAQQAKGVPITFTELVNTNSTQRHRLDNADFEEYPFSKEPWIDDDPCVFKNPERHPASSLLYWSKKLEPVRIMLIHAGLLSFHDTQSRILAWSTLYKIRDTIIHFCKTKEDKDAVRKTLKTFDAACNNISVLGIYARHGENGTNADPQKYGMTIEEASSLVLELANLKCLELIADARTASGLISEIPEAMTSRRSPLIIDSF